MSSPDQLATCERKAKTVVPAGYRDAAPRRQDGQGRRRHEGDRQDRRHDHPGPRSHPRGRLAGHDHWLQDRPPLLTSVAVGDKVAFELKLHEGLGEVTAITKR